MDRDVLNKVVRQREGERGDMLLTLTRTGRIESIRRKRWREVGRERER